MIKLGEDSGWLISKVFEDFIEHKTKAGKLTEKLKDNYVNYFSNFLYFQKDQDITSYYNGKSAKTEAGIRQVPIHKRLIELGLLCFAENQDGHLFPNANSKAITRWFASFKSKVGILLANDFVNRRVFHSFRHTFITKASDRGISQQLITAVVGHEAKKTITDHYNHSKNLKSLSKVTDAIDYGY